MAAQEGLVVHAVEMVAGQDEHQPRAPVEHVPQVAPHRVGRTGRRVSPSERLVEEDRGRLAQRVAVSLG